MMDEAKQMIMMLDLSHKSMDLLVVSVAGGDGFLENEYHMACESVGDLVEVIAMCESCSSGVEWSVDRVMFVLIPHSEVMMSMQKLKCC